MLKKTHVATALLSVIVGSTYALDDQIKQQVIQLAQSNDVVSQLKAKAANEISNSLESKTRETLAPLLDNLEVSISAGDALNGPTYEIIGLKAYDNDGKDNSFLFSQLGLNRYDKRNTVNIGMGYRHLTADEAWLFGGNAFYDHEFPNDHQRWGYGLEAKSTPISLGYNAYKGISGYKADRSGIDSKALDGHDLRADLTLPYLPGAAVGYQKFVWEGDAGANDLKGEKISLKGSLSDSLSIDAGRTYYDGNSRADDNFVTLTYRLRFGDSSSSAKLFDVTSDAYTFGSMAKDKYSLVKRENRIIKQKKFATTVTGA